MIIVIDVYYHENEANAAAVVIKDWESEEIIKIETLRVKTRSPYISGEFYKRELPCILQVLDLFKQEEIDIVVIDGYVVLDDTGKIGLGGYLYKSLGESIPVIGVAKRAFVNNSKNQVKVKRGKSEKPLFVTSLGIDLNESAERIKNMKGAYRIPDILKLVDQNSRIKEDDILDDLS